MELLTGLALEALANVRLPIGKWKDESLVRRLPLFAEASTPAPLRVEIFRRGVRFRWAETSNAVQSFEKGHCEREAVCFGKVETVWRVHVDLERILFSWFRLISALLVSARGALLWVICWQCVYLELFNILFEGEKWKSSSSKFPCL